MLAMKVFEAVQIGWASTIFFVPKKGGTVLTCIYYRAFIAVTTTNLYPIPRMDEYFDSLRDVKIFLIPDANSSYWLIEVHKSDHEKPEFKRTMACTNLQEYSSKYVAPGLHFNALLTSCCPQWSRNMLFSILTTSSYSQEHHKITSSTQRWSYGN